MLRDDVQFGARFHGLGIKIGLAWRIKIEALSMQKFVDFVHPTGTTLAMVLTKRYAQVLSEDDPSLTTLAVGQPGDR